MKGKIHNGFTFVKSYAFPLLSNYHVLTSESQKEVKTTSLQRRHRVLLSNQY